MRPTLADALGQMVALASFAATSKRNKHTDASLANLARCLLCDDDNTGASGDFDGSAASARTRSAFAGKQDAWWLLFVTALPPPHSPLSGESSTAAAAAGQRGNTSSGQASSSRSDAAATSTSPRAAVGGVYMPTFTSLVDLFRFLISTGGADDAASSSSRPQSSGGDDGGVGDVGVRVTRRLLRALCDAGRHDLLLVLASPLTKFTLQRLNKGEPGAAGASSTSPSSSTSVLSTSSSSVPPLPPSLPLLDLLARIILGHQHSSALLSTYLAPLMRLHARCVTAQQHTNVGNVVDAAAKPAAVLAGLWARNAHCRIDRILRCLVVRFGYRSLVVDTVLKALVAHPPPSQTSKQVGVVTFFFFFLCSFYFHKALRPLPLLPPAAVADVKAGRCPSFCYVLLCMPISSCRCLCFQAHAPPSQTPKQVGILLLFPSIIIRLCICCKTLTLYSFLYSSPLPFQPSSALSASASQQSSPAPKCKPLTLHSFIFRSFPY
jgi:hypothetical protein